MYFKIKTLVVYQLILPNTKPITLPSYYLTNWTHSVIFPKEYNGVTIHFLN